MSCLRHDMCGICGRNCYSAFCRGRLHTSHMHCTRKQVNIPGRPYGWQYAVAWTKQLRLNCCVCVSFRKFCPFCCGTGSRCGCGCILMKCMLWHWGSLLARSVVAVCCMNSAAVLCRVNNVWSAGFVFNFFDCVSRNRIGCLCI